MIKIRVNKTLGFSFRDKLYIAIILSFLFFAILIAFLLTIPLILFIAIPIILVALSKSIISLFAHRKENKKTIVNKLNKNKIIDVKYKIIK